MAIEVEVIINPDGTTEIRGEGFETKALKEELKNLGSVTEEHIGVEHQHDHSVTKQQQKS